VQEEGDEFDFSQFEAPETYGQRALGWVKGLFTPEQAQAPAQAIQAPAQAPAQASAMQPAPAPGTPQAIPQAYAHGGAVRTMRKKYKDGGKAIDIFGGESPNLTDEERYERTQKIVLDRGTARADAVFDKMHEIGRSNKSIYGAGPEQEAAIKVIDTDPTPEQDGTTPLPPEAPAGQQTPPSTPAPTPAPGQGAGVSGGEQDIDFSTQARQVMPEDIPSYSVKDWEKQRRYWAAYAISQGEDPFAAMKKVDDQQLSGFSRYAMQATALMDGGDMEGATRALYAAYQYFPNGKDVRFGIQKGKDGNRQIIAMGSDEGEDGKSSGPPQILNTNTISRMIENMSKPGALKTWTKDWQATEAKLWEQGFKRDELKETGRHNRAMEAVGMAGAEARSRSGGPKQSDFDRANTDFLKAVEMESFENQEQADWMMAKMSEIYANFGGTGQGGLQYPTVIKQVRHAINTGDFSELDRLYGIQ